MKFGVIRNTVSLNSFNLLLLLTILSSTYHTHFTVSHHTTQRHTLRPTTPHCTSFQSKFGNPRRVVEVSYNLVSALQKYSFDCDCSVFLSVMHGEVSEDIWLDQQALLQDILVSVVKSAVCIACNTVHKFIPPYGPFDLPPHYSLSCSLITSRSYGN